MLNGMSADEADETCPPMFHYSPTGQTDHWDAELAQSYWMSEFPLNPLVTNSNYLPQQLPLDSPVGLANSEILQSSRSSDASLDVINDLQYAVSPFSVASNVESCPRISVLEDSSVLATSGPSSCSPVDLDPLPSDGRSPIDSYGLAALPPSQDYGPVQPDAPFSFGDSSTGLHSQPAFPLPPGDGFSPLNLLPSCEASSIDFTSLAAPSPNSIGSFAQLPYQSFYDGHIAVPPSIGTVSQLTDNPFRRLGMLCSSREQPADFSGMTTLLPATSGDLTRQSQAPPSPAGFSCDAYGAGAPSPLLSGFSSSSLTLSPCGDLSSASWDTGTTFSPSPYALPGTLSESPRGSSLASQPPPSSAENPIPGVGDSCVLPSDELLKELVHVSKDLEKQETVRRKRRSRVRVTSRETRKISRPEACEVCGRGFPYKGDLRRHVKARHPESVDLMKKLKIDPTPFPCSYCGKEFPLEHNMQKHVKKFHLTSDVSGGGS